ncbi:hypothetical protein SAMN02745130_02771 [Thiothrix eikelboomii]|uniref:Uncharacterized protein n=1 Tax=Thiothrix eikelboomii TaxID=92487 RepID=A0A1T4XC12_9GAMM|nr:hypothetical protein [Thiothrix eikelboomii]SKA86979.1 hypothetical protein SAMN02745130_02771 [Thiothrix eikelboomii]
MFDSLRSRTAHRFVVLISLLAIGSAAVYWQQSKASKFSGLPPKISYYHWANSYTDDPASLKTYAPAQLYLKLLDIGYRDQQLSINPTDLRTPPSLPITPVVFLDNNALKADVLETVYAQILSHIPPQTYQRLQMDCDWTEQTRDTYFAFLSRLKADYPHLSVTLRLHQVKYATRTGVPPAERAALMYYNMSDIRDPETKNYILDPAVGQTYLQNFEKYPLPLDLALPLYQQTRVIRRGKLVHLANSAEPNAAKTERLDEHHYTVTQGHYWQEYYLYPEDELRVDTVDLKSLQQAAQQLKTVMQPDELIFYTLQDANRFTPDQLAAIAADFSSRSQPQ